MKVTCELMNYKRDKTSIDNPQVIVEDDGTLSNQVRISIGEECAVVRADELIKAIDACTNMPF
jgi:hypothetical protein